MDQLFGDPMGWAQDWDSRPLEGPGSKKSLYQGAVGEDFLARHIQVALGPGRAAGAVLGARARQRGLGDFDMIIHIAAGTEDHIMVVDAKNLRRAHIDDRQVVKAQKRLAELVSSGGLGETRRGKKDGWHGVTLSYHLVFAGEATTEEWQRDARTKLVHAKHHPRTDVHDLEHVIVIEPYETLIGDVLCRAMRSTSEDSRAPRYGTRILDMIADQYYADSAPRPFRSIMERDRSVAWSCSHPSCWKPPGRGYLLAHLHDQAHVSGPPRGSRWFHGWIDALAAGAQHGVPEWKDLLAIDDLWDWTPGSAAAALLYGDSHPPYPGPLRYLTFSESVTP